MDFTYSSEQQLLRDSARKYFENEGSFESRSAPPSEAADQGWRHYAESGWLAMSVPELYGGLDASFEDLVILCEELGRGLAQAPFVAGAVLPARVLLGGSGSPECARLLTDLAGGVTRIAVSCFEPGSRYEFRPRMQARATADGGYQLTGTKVLVAGGAHADKIIVAALIDGAAGADALFAVNTDRPGVNRRSYELMDGAMAADFSFDEVTVPPDCLIAAPGSAIEILQRAVDEAQLCLCAEMLGAMDRAVEITTAYLKIRKQFGRPLADYQALQHAVAEMAIDSNSARSLVYRALAALDATGQERCRAICGCAINVMQMAKAVCGSAIHLHGAIGMTSEYSVGHYLRRVLVAERVWGDREQHFARYLDAE